MVGRVSFLWYPYHIPPPMKCIKALAALLIFGLFVGFLNAKAQSQFRSEHLKYVDEARTQAISGTLVPISLGVATVLLVENKTIETTASLAAVYGILAGPSFGNFYAKDYLRGSLGVAARLGAGYLLLDATREIAGDDMADALGWDDKSVSLGSARTLIGAGVILGSAVYNVVSSKASVNRYNDQIGYTAGITPAIKNGQLVPMVTATVNF